MTLDEAIRVLRQHNVTGASVLRITRGQALEKDLLAQVLDSCEQLISEKAEYKRLLKAAVEDFAKLDRENAWNKNCMMPEMDCADCPLSWDSVDDSVEPCHNWRYADEALALIGEDANVPASADDANVSRKSGSWISCEDRLPKENILVLCYARSTTGEGNSCFLGAIVHGEFWFLQVNDIGHVSFPVLHWEVTHWQPLPKSPKDGDTNG